MNKLLLHSCFWSSGNYSSVPKFWKSGKIKTLMRNFLVLVFSAFTFLSATAQAPTVAAPDPSCDSGDVISMFSNVYTDVTVDTWLTVWSSANLADIQIAGNDTKEYTNVDFLGIETVGANLIDASAMVNFHMDIWTPNMTTFRVKLVDFGPDLVFGGGDDSEHEIEFVSPAQNEWVSYDIPLADFTGLASTEHIAQLILSGLPTGGGTVYVDNVYYSNSGCVTAAPDPTEDAANVISLFSNVYTDVPVDTWLTVWSSANLEDLQISGNDTKKYTNIDFLGIETVGPNVIDATSMTNFHIDVWTPNMTIFRVKLVDFGADGIFGGGDDSEHEIEFVSPAQNEWVSYDIPLADFTGLASREHLAQYILSGQPIGGGTAYVDNVYFSMATTAEIELCVDMSCFPGVQAPSVFGFFNGWNAGANPITDPDGDGFYCATVTMDPGPQQYKFFDQLQGPENFSSLGPCNALDGVNINRVIDVVAGVNQSVSFGWATCDPTCTPPPAPNVELCVDMTCLPGVQAPSVFGFFNGWNAGANPVTDPDGDGIYCATVLMTPGDQQFKFFDQIQGPEEFSTLGVCNVQDGPNINRFVTVTGAPQSFTFGWESCDLVCTPPPLPPDLPITFEDEPTVDYNLGNFGGMNSFISVDPTDPTNMVVCSNKTNGAQVWAGTVAGDAGLANPIPFTATETKMTVRVWSPFAGTPFLLKVENSAGGPTAEVLMTTTSAMTWETLVYDFTADPNFNLANTYNKVVVFANFGNIGANQTYYWDDVMMCPSEALTLVCPALVELECTDSTDPAFTGEVTAEEVGGGNVVFTFVDVSDVTPCDGGTITRTWTGVDGCGNTGTCDQIIKVNAAPGPVITCPADAVVACIDDFVLDPNTAAATSECGTIEAIYIKNPLISGVPGCDGTVYTYIYVAVDNCGRSSECEQQVVIENSVMATINVPAGGTVECFDDIDISVDDATVNSGCADYNLYLVPPVLTGEKGCPGTTYTYMYRLVDACGNTVEEPVIFTNGANAAPTITAPDNQVTDCLGAVSPNPANAIVTTSCGTGSTVTVTGPQIFGPVDCNGSVYRYTYTVTDDCGRTATDIQDFTVNNGPPVFEGCPEDNWLVLNCEDFGGESGTIDVIEAWIASVKASSSCGAELTVFNNFNPNNINTCVNNGYNTVTFRATDNCGRSSFCTGVYVVVDTEAPEIIEEAQDHWEMCNFNTQANLTAWVQNHGGAVAMDGCSNNNISWQASPSNPTINCIGATGTTSVTVSFIVTDNCGNKTTTTATFNALAAPGLDGEEVTQLNGNGTQSGAEFTEEASSANQMTLYQNRPNPFQDETVIGFNLPVETSATLTIYDINGRVLKVIEGNYYQGLNEVSINRSELGGSGVRYYTLSTQNETATKIMIITD